MPTELVLGVYRHYKGGHYRVLAVAKHSETMADYVVYEALSGTASNRYWIRPIDMFVSSVMLEGKQVQRFEWVEP